MGWFIRFGLLRLRARWRSLITLIFGVVLAALIGANASLYTTAISQVGLGQFLDVQPSEETNILTRISLAPSELDTPFADEWATYDAQVTATTDETFNPSDWLANFTTYAETQPFIAVQNGEDLPNTRFRLAHYDDLFNRVDLIEGRLPTTPTNDTIQAEVLLNAQVAVLAGLTVGDTIDLDQRGWDTSRIFSVEIVGLIIPTDPQDSYWFDPSPLRFDPNRIETNLLTTRSALETIPPQYVPQTTVQIGWRINTNYAELPYTRIEQAADNVEAYAVALNDIFLVDESLSGSYFHTTNIPTLMRDYDEQIVFVNIPFGLLLLQLAALVLFFLMLIAALVRRGERREIAMFQSRGATDLQVIAARSIESLIICIGATLIAPLLAQLTLQQIIPLLTGIDQIPLEINLRAYLLAGAASLVAFIALTLTLYPVMRQPLVTAGGIGARGGKQTIWQRYYLDVVLLIIGVVALYQLTQSQTVIANNLSDETRVDPLLLIAPTLLFVAFSSVLLRLFPYMMSMIARFYTARTGLEAALASWQVSRQPLHYGRITFLLALAIGIGWFAVAYQSTIVGNQSDQSAYFVGGDVRIVYDNPESPDVAASMRRIADLPDVTASTHVTRYELQSVTAVSGAGRRSRQSGELLAINPQTFNEVVSWRSDLGILTLPENDFDTTIDVGIQIPEGTERIAFWAQAQTDAVLQFGVTTETTSPYPQAILNNNFFSARIQDDTATYQLAFVADEQPIADRIQELRADLGEEEFLWQPVDVDGDGTFDDVPRYDWPNDGWVYFETDLTQLELSEGSSLFALDIFAIPNNFFATLDLSIGALQFIDSNGDAIEVDYTTRDIEILGAQNTARPQELTITESQVADYGSHIIQSQTSIFAGFNAPTLQYALMFDYPELSSVTTNTPRGVGNAPAEETEEELSIVGLPVLVSNSLAEVNSFTLDQDFNLVIESVSPWFRVDRIIDFYPTLYQERPYLVVDASLLNFTLRRATGSGLPPNELWLSLPSGTDQTTFVSELRLSDDADLFAEIITVASTEATFETDVLSLGVIGLLFISFVIGLALSVVSLLTYISLTVQSRIGEFAVLRALGLTTSRMVFSIIIEQVLVLIAALILGAIIGQFLSLQVVPPLALSAAGGAVTPPFVLTIDWLAIAQYLLIMGGVLILVLMATAFGIRRAATAESLRLTEE